MRKTLIISVFPYSGRTFCFRNNDNYFIRNLVKSNFVKETFSIENYVDEVTSSIGIYDIIFIDFNEEIWIELERRGIDYYLVMPLADERFIGEKRAVSIKNEWIGRALPKLDVVCTSEYDKLCTQFDLLTDLTFIESYTPTNIYFLYEEEYFSDKVKLILWQEAHIK